MSEWADAWGAVLPVPFLRFFDGPRASHEVMRIDLPTAGQAA